MSYPFIKRDKDRKNIKLHKRIYKRELINKAKKNLPESILSVKSQKNYYLIEIDAESKFDYFDFLNYLIYLYRK